MKKKYFYILIFFLIFNKLYSEDIMIMKLKDGDVELELYSDIAPKHVERFKTLAKKGLYARLAKLQFLTN